MNASNPFHLARAYGLTNHAAVQRAAPTEGVRVVPMSRADAARFEPSISPRPVDRLVAGVVPGGIDFDASAPRPASLPFYRHPADQNAAATSIESGRRLDVRG